MGAIQQLTAHSATKGINIALEHSEVSGNTMREGYPKSYSAASACGSCRFHFGRRRDTLGTRGNRLFLGSCCDVSSQQLHGLKSDVFGVGDA